MAAHTSILAWRIPCTEEPGGVQSIGSQRVGHDWVTNTFTVLSSDIHWLPADYLLSLTRLKLRCWPPFLIWNSGSSCRLNHVTGKIQFLAVVGLKSPFSCWLLAGDSSGLLGVISGSCPVGPLHLGTGEPLSCWNFHTFLISLTSYMSYTPQKLYPSERTHSIRHTGKFLYHNVYWLVTLQLQKFPFLCNLI